MLPAQADQASQSHEEIVASLFARADVDGDGALNADELGAEAAIRKAAGLDAGYAPDTVFMSKDQDSDGLVRPDEMLVARRLHMPASAIKLVYEMPADIVARMREAGRAYADRGVQVSPPVETLTPEARQARLDQLRADIAERNSGPAGTTRYLNRKIEGLRETARADLDQAPVTDSLASRLMQRTLAGWSAETAAPAA